MARWYSNWQEPRVSSRLYTAYVVWFSPGFSVTVLYHTPDIVRRLASYLRKEPYLPQNLQSDAKVKEN